MDEEIGNTCVNNEHILELKISVYAENDIPHPQKDIYKIMAKYCTFYNIHNTYT